MQDTISATPIHENQIPQLYDTANYSPLTSKLLVRAHLPSPSESVDKKKKKKKATEVREKNKSIDNIHYNEWTSIGDYHTKMRRT